MTYYEKYSTCKNDIEIKEIAIRDTKVAIFLGNNPDRIKAIEDAMNKAIADKTKSEEKTKKARNIINDVMQAENIPYEGTDDR
jgi:hypothetical protein